MKTELSVIEKDVLLYSGKNAYTNQRAIADGTGYSLGVVNNSLKVLKEEGLLDGQNRPTAAAQALFKENSPRNAIILAAGVGLRMIPINNSVAKGLLEVKGEILIERLITQLRQAGITQIYVVVGFMKENFEYLIDKYGVTLIVNKDYALKNNLHSLSLAAKHISNSYIAPCDIRCENNPFGEKELYPWYMVSDELTAKSDVKAGKSGQLTGTRNGLGNRMVGIAYIDCKTAEKLRERIYRLDGVAAGDSMFWEEALNDNGQLCVCAKLIKKEEYCEINTYEQLRAVDKNSGNLQSEEISLLAQVFGVGGQDIKDVRALKVGMTNRSFLFSVGGKRYIMRIPGEGTDNLINRRQEASVYACIKDKNICDDIIYIDEKTGYKISRYFEGAHCCDPYNLEEVEKCMKYLKSFHGLRLKVGHEFNLFERIEFYESLRKLPSMYRDYSSVKDNVLKLRKFIESFNAEKSLTHIDAVCDNFLFVDNGGREEIRLIDWEYAGMQDCHVDIAMFIIYSCYGEEMAEKVIDFYFENACPEDVRYKIYAYIAVCGLLWSNWCEYKFSLGVEFGEYSLMQYRFAKKYSRKVLGYLEARGE